MPYFRHDAVEILLFVAWIHLGIMSLCGLVAFREIFLTHLRHQCLSSLLWHSHCLYTVHQTTHIQLLNASKYTGNVQHSLPLSHILASRKGQATECQSLTWCKVTKMVQSSRVSPHFTDGTWTHYQVLWNFCRKFVTTSAEEGGYVFTSVCLSVRQITEKVVSGFWRNFLEG